MTSIQTKSEATNGNIPINQSGYNADFLSQAIDMPVKSFEVQNFGAEGAGGGFAGGIVCRFKNIEYEGNSDEGNSRPKTLILKWLNMANGPTSGGAPGIPFISRLLLFSICKMEMNTEEVQRREYDFFNGKSLLQEKIANAGVKLPDCYACDMLDYGDPNLCCMVWCNKKTNMRRYMFFGDITDEMADKYEVTSMNITEKHIEIAIKNMAKIHAVNWGKKKNSKLLKTIKNTYWYPCVFGWTKVLNDMKKKYSFQKYINEYGSERTYLAENKISEPLVRLETLYRDKISTILENLDDKQTILHGDYHCGNIMFLKDVDDAIILDWQMYGHGHFAYEFVYFVYSALANAPYVDRTRTFNYLKLYYDELIQLDDGTINKELTWEEAKRVFVCVCLELFVWVIAIYRADIKKRNVRDAENKRDKRFVEVNGVLDKRDENFTLFVVDLMNNLKEYGL